MNFSLSKIASAFIVFLLSNSSFSQTIINISSNNVKDTLGRINDGYVVYQSEITNQNSEIIVYKIATGETIPITNNLVRDINPEIGVCQLTSTGSFKTYITWLHWDGNDYEVACCAVEEPSTVIYLTNDNINQGQPFVTSIGIGWTEPVSSETHVMMYYDSVITDISAQFSSTPCSDPLCAVKCINAELTWTKLFSGNLYYSQVLTRIGGNYYVYGSSYCGTADRSFLTSFSGTGTLISVIKEKDATQSDIYATVFANSLNVCTPIAATADDEREAVSTGAGSEGKAHIAYVRVENSVPHIYRFEKDWYSNSDPGATQKISSSLRTKTGLAGYRQHFAWLEDFSGTIDLMYYNGTTETRITNTPEAESDVHFDPSSNQETPQLVWTSGTGTTSEIYLRTFAQATGTTNKVVATPSTFGPNPVNDKLFIQSTAQSATILVYDVQGKIVATSTNKDELEVSSLPNGLYKVLVQTGDTLQSFTIDVIH